MSDVSDHVFAVAGADHERAGVRYVLSTARGSCISQREISGVVIVPT